MDKPLFLQTYFWDVEWKSFDPKSYSTFTIERILDLGNLQAIKWLQQQFSVEEITQVIERSRRLSKKSAHYWGLIYNIDKQKITCLNTLFQKQPNVVWKS